MTTAKTHATVPIPFTIAIVALLAACALQCGQGGTEPKAARQLDPDPAEQTSSDLFCRLLTRQGTVAFTSSRRPSTTSTRRSKERRDHLQAAGAGLHRSRRGLQRALHALVTADGAPIPPATGYVRAGAPICVPDETVAISVTCCPTSISTPARPRARPDGAVGHGSRRRSSRWGIVTGIPNAGQVNALETLNIRGERSITCKGEFDRARRRAAAGGRPGGVRGVPPAAGRARARSGARRPVRQQARPREAADVLRRVLGQELVRREGHALDGRQRRRLRHGRAAGRLDAGRRAAGQGRHHLWPSRSRRQVTNTRQRAGGDDRRRSSPRRTTRARRGAARRATPYDTERSPGFSSGGAGASVAANLVTCAHLRDDRRLVPDPRQRQQRGQPGDDQGRHLVGSAAGRRSTSITARACCAARWATRRACSTR